MLVADTGLAITLHHPHEGDKEALIEELTRNFEGVLDGLVIDLNDPNSLIHLRLAKMYTRTDVLTL